MQYVSIKKDVKKENGKTVFLVPVLNLKNAEGTTKQRIAHPLGDDYLEFETLEEAIKAIELSGFKYVLPDGTKPALKQEIIKDSVELDKVVYETLIKQTKDINSTVVAAAIGALSELNDEKLLDLFLEKMGEDNDLIRTSSINAILNFGSLSVKKLLSTLKDENWVRRNSALICLSRLVESESVNPETLFPHLIEMTNDKNTIVKTSAISALGKAYKLYKKGIN